VQASDIDDLLSVECEEPALVIVPSRDGMGTNAILRMPPALFPSHFGMGSFAKHVGEAERIGARVIFRRNPRLEMDVDDEADLRALLKNDLTGTETGRWLRESESKRASGNTARRRRWARNEEKKYARASTKPWRIFPMARKSWSGDSVVRAFRIT